MDFGLRGELQIGGTWVDATGNLLKRQSLTHTRGRPDLGARVDPSTCRPVLNNTDGRFSPDNPLSPHYGQFGRNTPFRLSIAAGSPFLSITGTGGNAQTPDHASLDITGDMDIRLDARLANWDPGTELDLAGRFNFAGGASWRLYMGTHGRPIWAFSPNGGAGLWAFTATDWPAITPSGRLALRVTVDADNGSSVGQVRFYTATSITGPWTQLGGTLSHTGVIGVFAGTAPLEVGAVANLSSPEPLGGAIYKFELRNGIDGTLVAAPDFTTQTPGTTSFTDSTGKVWTVTGAASVTNRRTRLTHELAAYPTEWRPSGAHAWVDAQTAGILRRLRRGNHALASTLRRRIPSGNPLAYWPMEEGANATQFYSPTTGVRPLQTSGFDLAADDSLAGSSALPAVKGGANLSGVVPAPKTATTEWHTEFVYFLPNNGPATTRTVLQWTSTGTVQRWRLMIKTLGAELYGYDGDDVQVTSMAVDLSGYPALFNGWARWRLQAQQSGGNIEYKMGWTAIGGQSSSLTSTVAGTLGRLTGVKGPDGGYSTDLNGLVIGHIGAFPVYDLGTYSFADLGFSGETAGARMRRLADEENLPLTVCGAVADQTLVGSQRPNGVLDLLEEAADADGGILYEDREQAALRYRPRDSLYNQAPALVLDYNGPGLAPPLRPTGDDEATQNDVTVTRTGGSSARAVLEEGALSIQAPPNGVGIGYETSVDLSLYRDEQAEEQAYWLLHLGTYEGRRYPQVRVLVHRAPPELLDQILAVDVGDKIVIENPPMWVAPRDIELIVQGYDETWTSEFTWEITFNCSPGQPWTVAGTAYYEDFEDTTYEVTIAGGGTLPWTRTSAQAHTGTWSLRSGAITNNQTSDAIITVPAGMTEMRYWYWTSSEAAGAGFEGDRLLVLVDGVQVLRAQGTTPWTQHIVDVTGATTVTFRYVKDNSTAVGSDFAAIDNLSFTGRAPARVDTDGSVLVTAATSSAPQLLVATSDGPPWVTSPVWLPLDLALGGEEVRATAITSWATDTFTRTVSGGWGNADTGQAWTVVGGAGASDFSVGSGFGAHLLGTVDVSRRCGIDLTHPDHEVVVSVTTSATATGGSLYGGPLVRYVDANNLYMARIEFTTGNAVNLDLRKRTGGTESSLGTYASPITHAAGTYVRCRMRVQGSVIQAKVWPASGFEPAHWHVTAYDTSVTTSTYVGCRSISSPSTTNVNPSVRYDQFEVVSPQTMTVTRAVNGITKAHAAGTAISLADPAIVAL
ncbi:hypothetical protein ABZ330_00450 [Streptomyces sp. NPDC006172]|uniref:hypothetical protein n=1 Tax=Streptomyces sp. NPDC006172 TaxID=3154470 RepID=UPI0033C45CA8